MSRKKKKLNRTTLTRRLVQLTFASFVLVSAVRHSTSAEHLPSTDALCPFGAVETLYKFAATGDFVQKTHPSNLVLGIGLLLSAVLAGASFCGWVCPFGALNDLLTWIRKKLRLPELTVPTQLDRILTFGRYVTLIGITYATAVTAKLWFSNYDPYRTIFSLGWLFEFNLAEHWPAYLIALIVIAGGLFIPRFWCRYLCPQGVLLGLIQRISIIKIWRDPALCIDCGRCDRVCPSRLNVAAAAVVRGDCTGCLECVETCPKAGALSVGNRATRFNKYLLPAIAIVALLGTVLTAKATGYWQTSGRQMIDPNAELTSSDIKGWMDLEYISEGYGIPLSELRAMMRLPPDTPGHTALKDIEHVIEVREVRALIAEYLGEEYEHEDHEDEPQDEPTPEPTHEPGSGAGDGSGNGQTPLPAGQTLPATDIKGRMTLQETSDQCNVPLDVLYAELGLPDDLSSNTVLRNVGAQVDGFEVSVVREVVAAYQAAHP